MAEFRLFGCAAFVCLLFALPLAAQQPAGGDGVSAPSAPAAASGSYPPNPRAFTRGNPTSGPTGDAGLYFNLFAFVLVVGLFALWASTSNWVYEDSRSLKVRTEFWCSIVLVSGVVGFVAAFCMPGTLFGLLALLLCYGVPLGIYIKERNDRVPQSSRVMTPEHIQRFIARKLGQLGIPLPTRSTEEAILGPSIHFIGKSTTGRGADEERSRQVENSKGYMAAKELVYDALLRRSTDIHLEPKDSELSIRLRIDGVMYPAEPFDRPTGDAVLNIFKVLSAMDITEKRRAQDGSFRAELDDRRVDFRVATQGTRHGEKMSLRILDQSNSVNSLAGLGLRKQLQMRIRELIHQPHGLLLVCGPTGAGKSTTLYAALSDIDAYQTNIITVEDPIEYNMANVNQIEINSKAGQNFATSLRSILRQDPDVVMIGEIRDGETAEIACQAANTGHMVFSTVHANDTITALYRIIELGVEPFMIANSLSAVLAQRLVRRLCSTCREAYKPTREFLEKAGLPADRIDTFYRPPKDREEVCQVCGGLGYIGRIGVFELLVITEKMRDLVREKAAMTAIRGEARKNGMLYMREEALRLLAQGITSINELQRVVQ